MTDGVSLKMYNVGFGDCLLVRVVRGDRTWRMLIDCGVHSQGARQDIDLVVDMVVDALSEECGGDPHLDVVVATHRHADHVSGFVSDRWEDVTVGEVWLPYVEDEDDPDGDALRRGIERASTQIVASAQLAAASGGSPRLAAARSLAENARPNQKAMDRLLNTNNKGFARRHRTRYWPDIDSTRNRVRLADANGDLEDAVAHIVGPSRSQQFLKRMAPPKSAEWLHLNAHGSPALAGTNPPTTTASTGNLFAEQYVTNERDIPSELQDARRTSALRGLTVLDDTLLAAAARLDRVVNNTSLFIILEIGGVVIVLPGDAQQGAWEHVRSSPANRKLLSQCTAYKIGHHGSHNATPRAFLDDDWTQGGGFALLPWGEVERWPEIPKSTLMKRLHDKHTVLRFDQPAQAPDVTHSQDGHWVEVTFRT